MSARIPNGPSSPLHELTSWKDSPELRHALVDETASWLADNQRDHGTWPEADSDDTRQDHVPSATERQLWSMPDRPVEKLAEWPFSDVISGAYCVARAELHARRFSDDPDLSKSVKELATRLSRHLEEAEMTDRDPTVGETIRAVATLDGLRLASENRSGRRRPDPSTTARVLAYALLRQAELPALLATAWVVVLGLADDYFPLAKDADLVSLKDALAGAKHARGLREEVNHRVRMLQSRQQAHGGDPLDLLPRDPRARSELLPEVRFGLLNMAQECLPQVSVLGEFATSALPLRRGRKKREAHFLEDLKPGDEVSVVVDVPFDAVVSAIQELYSAYLERGPTLADATTGQRPRAPFMRRLLDDLVKEPRVGASLQGPDLLTKVRDLHGEEMAVQFAGLLASRLAGSHILVGRPPRRTRTRPVGLRVLLRPSDA